MRFPFLEGIIKVEIWEAFAMDKIENKKFILNDLEKLERYVAGQSDDNEKAWVESLFLNGEDDYTLYNTLEKDWNLMLRDSSPSQVNVNHLLDRVHHIIKKNEDLKRKNPLHKLMRIYSRVAAILFLPLIIAGGLFYSYLDSTIKTATEQNSGISIYAPLGARVSFKLPDGTLGMLNGGSKLSYSLPFNNNRHVNLEGEARFKVSHDEKHTFEITAGSSTVKVLGTSFNMSCYPDENYVEVVLEEGKVEYQNQDVPETLTMYQSDRLVFQNGQISLSITDPEKYIAWTEGKLVFRSDPMTEVVRRLERWYNVKIIIADQTLEKYSFRATFEDDSLEEVLRFLSMTSPIGYKISKTKALPDGTFKKGEVILFHKP
jgi:ferric-dicitrate binding protein FerR (iron transport regulator)